MFIRTTKNNKSPLMDRLRTTGTGERVLPLTQKQLSPSAAADLRDLDAYGTESNRRALAWLPVPPSKQDHEVAETDSLRLQSLLLSIESRALSCCIRVFSPTSKSRSALLIYKGRIIGTVFGSRDEPDQIFGRPAFDRAMADLLAPGNVLDAYRLSNELVLASASLFHDGLSAALERDSAIETYSCTADAMIANKSTGCIACMASSESLVSVTYFFEGKIIGVYSVAEGWLTQTQTAALNSIEAVADVEICHSVLRVGQAAADCLTESLTGLDFESKPGE
jgi:hypothetical protein